MAEAPYQVFLCRGAGAGSAPERWSRVGDLLRGRGVAFELVDVGLDRLPEAVHDRLESGRTDLVAAGGDGTLNALVQAVMAQAPELRVRARLGAVGVGSSNDYLKPVDPDAWVGGAQVALSRRGACSRELYALRTDAGVRYYLMNSSVGLVARGCAAFTAPPLWLRLARRVLGMPRAAMVHTVVDALVFQGVQARLTSPGRLEEGRFSGITVLKSPHVAQDVVFRTARSFTDGRFDVVCLTKVPASELATILEGFAREGPRDEGPVAFFQAAELEIEFPEPELVEYDGEVVRTRSAGYRILPEALTMLGRGMG